MIYNLKTIGLACLLAATLNTAALSEMTITASGDVAVGSTASPSDLTVYGTLSDDTGPVMPKGAIIMWSGSSSHVPAGWAICDGTNGTPDLRGRFLLGAGSHGVGAVGGNSSIRLSVSQMPAHTHTIANGGGHSHNVTINGPGDRDWNNGKSSDNTYWGDSTMNLSSDTQGSHSHTAGQTGGGAEVDITPPFFAVYFIMKL